MRTFVISAILYLIANTPAFSNENLVILALFKDKVIFKLDDRQYSMSPGDSIGNEITLISASSEEAVFEINGNTHRYTLGGHIGSSFEEKRPTRIVTIAPDGNGMYFVNGSINRHQTQFIVDTGATLISMNRHEAARFGIDYKLTGKKALTNTASGQETVYLVNLKSVRIGEIQQQNVPAAVHDSNFPNIILLGNSFLNNVSINRDGQLLQLIEK